MSKTRSIRLLEELDPLVDELPRGGFSFIMNRLLQLYFTDDKIKDAVDKVQFASQSEVEAPVDLPSIPVDPDPVATIKAKQKAEVEAVVSTPAAEPEPKPEKYNLLDSIVPK